MSLGKHRIVLWIGFFVITAFYIGVRLWRLTDSCLWFDEIFSVHAAQHEWGAMLSFLAQDLIHPPLFYALLKVWINVGGDSLLWLRLFPVFWSVVAIVPFVLLCRELKLETGEILTAFVLIAVNGALIRYAQEVRMYSLLFCLALFSLWLFVKLINHLPVQAETFAEMVRFPTSIFRALFIVNLLLIYTHYFGWLVVLTELIAFVYLCWGFSTALLRIQRGKRLGAFTVSIGLLILCFAPWAFWIVFNAAQQSAGLAQNLGWAGKPGLRKIFDFILILHEPFYYAQSNVDATNIWAIALPFALVGVGVIIAIIYKHGDEQIRLLTIFAIVPFVIAFVASWILPYSVWGARHLIIIFAPFILLVSISLWRVLLAQLRYSILGLLGVLILTGGLLHFTKKPQVFIWCGWRELYVQMDKIENAEQTTVYIFEDDGAYHLWYALKENPRFRIVSIDGYADMPEDKAYFLPRGFDEVKAADKSTIEGDRFWLAFRDTKWKSDKQVLQDLTTRGYKIGEPLTYRAQGVSAFLVPVERAN